jgi:hypothetical protein
VYYKCAYNLAFANFSLSNLAKQASQPKPTATPPKATPSSSSSGLDDFLDTTPKNPSMGSIPPVQPQKPQDDPFGFNTPSTTSSSGLVK